MARYVKTADARAAVKGHEISIIQKSGVNWKTGQRAHITCPYPGHGGSGDWRFYESKGLCFCSIFCLPKPSGGFDHLSKMRGDDPQGREAFERSKIEAMEMIGRTDLIREGSDETTGRKQRLKTWHEGFKTELLLNPPAHLRDDSLVLTYLASRQKVSVSDAAVPSTPYAGIRELEYIEDGEVIAVLRCIVFAMVNDTNKVTGAIRIYLSDDGTAKADLRYPDETRRPIKPMTRGSRVGGAVLFGNRKVAIRQASCEGIENGSAIALAAQRRGDDKVLVACGGN